MGGISFLLAFGAELVVAEFPALDFRRLAAWLKAPAGEGVRQGIRPECR
jgi:hypothetical protein